MILRFATLISSRFVQQTCTCTRIFIVRTCQALETLHSKRMIYALTKHNDGASQSMWEVLWVGGGQNERMCKYHQVLGFLGQLSVRAFGGTDQLDAGALRVNSSVKTISMLLHFDEVQNIAWTHCYCIWNCAQIPRRSAGFTVIYQLAWQVAKVYQLAWKAVNMGLATCHYLCWRRMKDFFWVFCFKSFPSPIM